MTLDRADVFGLLGSLCLLIPPLMDQWSRLRIRRLNNEQPGKARSGISPVSDSLAAKLNRMRRSVSIGYERQRNSFSSRDTFMMMLGALFLAVSYAL